MTPTFTQQEAIDDASSLLLDAIRRYAHPDGNVYVISIDDIAGYLHERPDLVALLENLDTDEVAMEIFDAIGSLGLLELVEEHAIRETIQDMNGWSAECDRDDPMDGDHASALASAGWGTDEDYGCFDCDLE